MIKSTAHCESAEKITWSRIWKFEIELYAWGYDNKLLPIENIPNTLFLSMFDKSLYTIFELFEILR